MEKQGITFAKKDLSVLFGVLRKLSDEIIAPVHGDGDGNFLRMSETKSLEEISFDGISWFTSKKYVFPEKQTLFSFKGQKISVPKASSVKRVLFGLRLCDLNAFYVNDHLFLHQKPAMPSYEKFRENLTLVGFWCDEAQDEYCFCESMNLAHRYDLCLFDLGDEWHLKFGSARGKEIFRKFESAASSGALKKEDYVPRNPACDTKVGTHEIEALFKKDEVWKKGAEDCLSCGDCTTLCPTCLCYDVEDDVELGENCGERCAKWDSCMYKDFTAVAGGHVFREKLEERFRHRIFHKLQYFREQFNESMCTGCGRCIRGCPTKIDWTKLIE